MNEKIKSELTGKKIHIVPYGHSDYSWVHTRAWHIFRYVTMLREALDILDNSVEYKYSADSYATFLEPVFTRHPEIVEGLRKHVRSGRFSFCGTYSNIRPNMTEGEAFVRNIIIGRAKFKEKFPDSQITVFNDTCDVSASHTQLPQLITKGGYKYFRFGRPSEILRRKGIPFDFIFKGMDGTSIISSYVPYGGLWNRETMPAIFDQDTSKALEAYFETELKQIIERFPTDNIYQANGCDDGIPLQYYHPSGRLPLIDQVNKFRDAGVDIRFSTPDDYFGELDKEENRKRLKVIDYNYDIADVPFNICLGGEKSLQDKRLAGAAGIVAAEKANAFSGITGGRSWANEFTELWEENLFCSAHASQWSYTEDQADLTERASRVIDRSKYIRERSYDDIAGRIDFSEANVAVIFNMHDKNVRKAVRLTITTPDPEKLKLHDAFGKELEFVPVHPYIFSFMETVVFEWDFLVFIDIPANGYNSVIVSEGRLDVVDRIFWDDIKHPEIVKYDLLQGAMFSISNKVIRLDFTKNGLTGISDLANDSCTSGKGVYNDVTFKEYSGNRIDMPVNDIKEEHKAIWTDASVIQTENKYAQAVLTGYAGQIPIKQTISIYSDLPEVHIETKTDIPVCLDGILLCGIPCEDITSLYAGIPFGSESRRVDLEPYLLKEYYSGWDEIGGRHRTIDGLFYAKDFIATTDGGMKISYVTLSGDRYYIYDKERKMASHIANATTRLTEGWEMDINTTAFSSYGKHVSRYVITVHSHDAELCDIQQRAEGHRSLTEYVRPVNRNNGDELPAGMSFISIPEDNVRLSAFYREEDSYTLRVWEAAGKNTSSSVLLPFEPVSVTKTDLIENVIDDADITINGRTVIFRLGPHEIATFRLHIK